MAGPTPAGFDAAKVVAGLHKAMAFGAPSLLGDRATFVMPSEAVYSDPRDDDNVPFSVAVRPVRPPAVSHVVPCAIEYYDAAGKMENFGLISPSRVQITLLADDFALVEGFEYAVIGGLKYLYRKTEPPVALGSIDVWTVWCQAEDDQ